MTDTVQFVEGIPLHFRRSARAKRVLLKLVPGKGLEVVLPSWADEMAALEAVDGRRQWIRQAKARLEARGHDLSGAAPALPVTIHFQLINKRWQCNYVNRGAGFRVRENVNRLLISGPADDHIGCLRALQKFVARKAREILVPMVNDMAWRTGLQHSSVRIRNQKTRWGSCSSKGMISLNARAVFLPERLVSHLLIHELCHLRHPNHGPHFWALVEQFEPNYKQLENELTNATAMVPDWMRYRG